MNRAKPAGNCKAVRWSLAKVLVNPILEPLCGSLAFGKSRRLIHNQTALRRPVNPPDKISFDTGVVPVGIRSSPAGLIPGDFVVFPCPFPLDFIHFVAFP
jgi:hypothetical protein